ncbi:MAG: glycosyltransferase, partial [Bacteroidota bacterium]|nr:glycosyltransferase [Bacteroidota bacterium]
ISTLNLKGKIVCVYSGKLGGIYLEDEVFDFFKQCFLYWGEKFKIVLLTNTPQHIITDQLRRVLIPDNILIRKFVWHRDIPKYLSIADFALTPVKPVPTKRYCTPIKDGEYWAMGLPVVITSGISDDSEIIEKNNAGYVLKDLSDAEYLQAVVKIDELLKENIKTLKPRIAGLAFKYRNFTIAEGVYRAIYNNQNNESDFVSNRT